MCMALVQVLARLPHDAAIRATQGGGIACTCWASTCASEILTGHDDGAVLRWACAGSGQMKHVGTYSAAAAEMPQADGDVRNPVVSVNMIMGDTPCIVVRGGNAAELPQGVAIVHLARKEDESCAREQERVTTLPWFGTVQGVALVRPLGSFSVDDAPTAVITLTEGGYLCICDVAAAAPEPFAADFQARPVEATALVQARTTQSAMLRASVSNACDNVHGTIS